MSSDPTYQQLFNIDSIGSLVFQIVGTALIAVLSLVVSRAVRRRLMQLWAAGWACYAGALVAILLAFNIGHVYAVFIFLYFFLEYMAIALIFAACRYTATNRPPSWRFWTALVPCAVVAGALVAPALASFYVAFAIHGGLVAVGWAVCLAALWPALRKPDSGPGVRIVAVGLVLLCLDYFQHLPTALYYATHNLAINPYYYIVTAILDGMFEFVLGFGTVVVIVDFVRADLERANLGLQAAHAEAQEALHVDPLTHALTRYSFEASFRGRTERRSINGAVVVADLDGLKRINDTRGHAAGDVALRSVAEGLRALVRGEDRVYRWGGDEFVVVMVGAPEELARSRMAALNDAVNRWADSQAINPGKLQVSLGVAGFDSGARIEAAIVAADAAMYGAKSAHQS